MKVYLIQDKTPTLSYFYGTVNEWALLNEHLFVETLKKFQIYDLIKVMHF